MDKREILIALTSDGSVALGHIWRITAKKTDFYLDMGEESVAHLSLHGPNERFHGHRFHMRVDREAAASARARGNLVTHAIPRKGFGFDGLQIATHAFLVARIRFPWHLQRKRFRAAATAGHTPEIAAYQSGLQLASLLNPNDAWDIDLVVSYGEPFWPCARETVRDDSRVGPLVNDSGMWLTGTSYHRSQVVKPTPKGLSLRLPGLHEEPNRILAAGPGTDDTSGIYWFVESITARGLLEEATDAL